MSRGRRDSAEEGARRCSRPLPCQDYLGGAAGGVEVLLVEELEADSLVLEAVSFAASLPVPAGVLPSDSLLLPFDPPLDPPFLA